MMKRTDKSIANSRQKSRANYRQSKPKGCDRDKAKYEVKYTTEKLQSASLSRSIQVLLTIHLTRHLFLVHSAHDV